MKKSDYELLFMEERRAHFRFQGQFRGMDVTWDVCIESIETNQDQEPMQSMQISSEDSNSLVYARLRLAVPRVNEAEILKSIIMISNYKKLRTGTHKWRG